MDWTYDALGRLTAETRDEGNDSVANGGDYTDTYTLDLQSNRVQKEHNAADDDEDETIVSAYNARDQLTSEDSTIDAHDATYQYDANGSQTLKSGSAGDTVYHWDLHNRLVAIDTNDDGDTNDVGDTRYTYDSSGVRVSETTITDKDSDQQLETRTTTYLNDKDNPTGYAKAVQEHTTTTEKL